MAKQKKLSKASEAAMHEADRKATGSKDAVPAAENGFPSHSEAAHLGTAHAHTKPSGDMRQIELKEGSNRKVSRAGEVNRGE